MSEIEPSQLVALATELTASYVEKNAVRPTDLPGLITSIHRALAGLGSAPAEPVAAEPLRPAVNPKKSVTDDFIISLEDGRKLRSMKRYLVGLGMTPEEYRAKWGLPKDYPMVAPGYAKLRSDLATKIGLGRKAAAVAETPDPDKQPAKKRRRPAKAA